MRKYKLAVFIGRFQPYHYGHHSVISNALKIADNVLVLVGSSGGPRTHRNPFTFEERREMIADQFVKEKGDGYRLIYRPLYDHSYNDEKWLQEVQTTVRSVRDLFKTLGCSISDDEITLVGHSKDNTSYYLKLFPQWHSEDCGNINGLSSTDIRQVYFNAGVTDSIIDTVPIATEEFLIKFSETEDYTKLVGEYVFVDNYKAKFANYPFPPTFVTVDAVVVQSGHILLVRRSGYPGKGLWALPGGFLNTNEKIEDGVIRELREETRIKVPAPVLRGNIVKREVFDDPNRSSRGRTITHAFLIHLPADMSLPKVRGSDDAEKAHWFPISEVKREMMFEDHYSIIENMLGNI